MDFKKDVTILVNSCDKYEDAWEPFFKLFSIQWPDCPYRIILNTESKNFSCDYLCVETIHTGDCKTWTERMKKVLKETDSEFVLFFLEDFFLMSQVNVSAFNDIIHTMNINKKIGFVGFPSIRAYQPHNHAKRLTKFLYSTKRGVNFRVNASLGLWRKEFLQQMLFRDGNPWYFEWIAPKLSRYSEFLATCWNQKDCCIFNYETKRETGLGIFNGKWLPANKDLFDAYNIEVNFNNLGIITVEQAVNNINAENKCSNKKTKKIKQFLKHKRSRLNDIKRFPKLYPAFKKYCKAVHQEYTCK